MVNFKDIVLHEDGNDYFWIIHRRILNEIGLSMLTDHPWNVGMWEGQESTTTTPDSPDLPPGESTHTAPNGPSTPTSPNAPPGPKPKRGAPIRYPQFQHLPKLERDRAVRRLYQQNLRERLRATRTST